MVGIDNIKLIYEVGTQRGSHFWAVGMGERVNMRPKAVAHTVGEQVANLAESQTQNI